MTLLARPCRCLPPLQDPRGRLSGCFFGARRCGWSAGAVAPVGAVDIFRFYS